MKDKKGSIAKKRIAAIDWNEIHRRLDAAQAALERGGMPGAEEKKTILKARAKALAREPEGEAVAEKVVEVVEFLLAYEKYGIESLHVLEVYPMKELTPLPGTPKYVLGIINVRGKILPVIDLKKVFDLPEKGLTDLNKVIILHSDRMEFGILADLILGVRSVPLNELQSSLTGLTGIREEYLKGVTGERLVVLDGAKLLSDENIIVHEEVQT